MTRYVFASLLAVYVCSPLMAESSGIIKPGIALETAKATLRKFGYDADFEKNRQAAVSRHPDHDLAFCPLDDDITLVLDYDKRTNKIASMGISIIPERKPQAKRFQYDRNLLEIRFENGGEYWLKLRRNAKQGDDAK